VTDLVAQRQRLGRDVGLAVDEGVGV